MCCCQDLNCGDDGDDDDDGDNFDDGDDVLMFCCFAVPALVLLSCLRQILVLLLRPTHTTFENIEDGDDEEREDVGGGMTK